MPAATTTTPLDDLRTEAFRASRRANRAQLVALVALLPLIVAAFALMNGVKAQPSFLFPSLALLSVGVMLKGLSTAMRAHEDAKELRRRINIESRATQH